MKQKWEYAEPVFEADKYDEIILKYSPWSGHRRFAYDLASYYEPEAIVELGSFYGCSAFAFMQAIKDHGLRTRICAVDLWEAGDPYTWKDYKRDIYGFFKKVKTGEFGGIFAEMLKMPFDEANLRFDDAYIDILHIDGSHAYDDVRHDFELWLPKMKADGIILFHDISEQMLYGNATGSSIYWKELKKTYAYTLEMPHSWGLGILFLSKDRYLDFKEKVDVGYYVKQSLYDAEDGKDRIRRDHFRLLDAKEWIDGLQRDKQAAEADAARLVGEIEAQKDAYGKTIQEKEAYIADLQEAITGWKKEAEKIRRNYEHTLQEKEAYILELKQEMQNWKRENEKIQQDYEYTVQEKEAYILELKQETENRKRENEKIQQDYEHTIQGKDAYIQELEAAKAAGPFGVRRKR